MAGRCAGCWLCRSRVRRSKAIHLAAVLEIADLFVEGPQSASRLAVLLLPGTPSLGGYL
jgi:hypothetical protein